MDIKKKSHLLKSRAKELGYEIKLTHCQELVSKVYGHDTRHSALIQNKPSNDILAYKDMLINDKCQICMANPREKAIMIYSGDYQLWRLCSGCCTGKFKVDVDLNKLLDASNLNDSSKPADVSDRYNLTDITIKDVMFYDGEGSYKGSIRRVRKAFMFKLILSTGEIGDTYLFTPNMETGHSNLKVWNLTKQEVTNGWWDWPIQIVDFKF